MSEHPPIHSANGVRGAILRQIEAERARQDDLWGGAAHDDTHRPSDWLVILVRHVGLAAYDGSPSDVCHKTEATGGYDVGRYRKQLVRVAAVAVAALEAFDRRAGVAPVPDGPAPGGEGDARGAAGPGEPWADASARMEPDLDGDLFWQRIADREGEPILVLDHKWSDVDRMASPCVSYAVLADGATEWERENQIARVEPARTLAEGAS